LDGGVGPIAGKIFKINAAAFPEIPLFSPKILGVLIKYSILNTLSARRISPHHTQNYSRYN
jgi:hypothetical protein